MCKLNIKQVGSSLAAALLLAWSATAMAESPPGCSGCGVDIQITRTPGIIASGGTVTYTVRIGNDIAGSCDVVNAVVTLYPPGLNGQPDLGNPIVLSASLSMPSPTAPFVLATTPVVVTTSPGVTIAQARVDVTGPPGSCALSTVDTASGSATATVQVFHPCVQITKVCVNPCTLYGQPIQFSGTVVNCGDEALTGTISDDPAATITPNSFTGLAPGASLPFTGVYTPAGAGAALCGPFSDIATVTATGDSDGTQLTPVSSQPAVCLVCNNPGITVAKVCGPASIVLGASYQVSGQVCNTGDIPLDNVVVTDSLLGTVFGPATLAPGECQNIAAQTITPTVCGPSTDAFRATGTSRCGGDVNATSATCTTTVTSTPGITVTKTCTPSSITLGQSYTVQGQVCNTGDTALHNVVVTDSLLGQVFGPGTLAVGQCADITPHTITPTACVPSTDTFTATGIDACDKPANAASSPCTVQVSCPPHITVTKLVLCSPATPQTCADLTFSPTDKSATGVAGDNGNASFCYQITVVNDGQDVLNSVVVTDDKLGALNPAFPTTLAVGESVTHVYQGSWPQGTTLNTVTASGVGAASGTTVTANDQATAIVVPISLSCTVTLTAADDMDNSSDNHLTLPPTDAGSTLAGGFLVTVNNTGGTTVSANITEDVGGADLALANCVFVDDAGIPLATQPDPTAVVIAQGAHVNVLCDIVLGANACPGPDTITVTAVGTAVATTAVPCIYNSSGVAIKTAPTTCSGTIICQQPTQCRTTGGGTMYSGDQNCDCVLVTTTLYPLTSDGTATGLPLDHVSHGGQLGAPHNQQDCAQILADPCIRGQWQHNRHYVGKGNPRTEFDADFHSNTPKGIYDTLLCECLGCCGPDGVKQPNGAFTGLLNQGKFVLCNPQDHKVCGPMPRPAPANALIFSGVGTMSPASDNGVNGKAATWVVFRVYVEDRSEPGGFHPKGSVSPADIYCFQAWDTGILVAKKADPNALPSTGPLGDVQVFRAALSLDSCAFIQSVGKDGPCPPGSLPLSTVAGVSATVNDSGALHSGNQQIHPSTGSACTTVGGIPAPTVPVGLLPPVPNCNVGALEPCLPPE